MLEPRREGLGAEPTDDDESAIDKTRILEPQYVRMLKLSDQPCFPLKRRKHACGNDVLMWHLQGHMDPFDRIPSLVHSGKATLGQLPFNTVLANAATRSQHVRVSDSFSHGAEILSYHHPSLGSLLYRHPNAEYLEAFLQPPRSAQTRQPTQTTTYFGAAWPSGV